MFPVLGFALAAMITLAAQTSVMAADRIRSGGAEIIVAGSAIFGTKDPGGAVRELREATIQWV